MVEEGAAEEEDGEGAAWRWRWGGRRRTGKEKGAVEEGERPKEGKAMAEGAAEEEDGEGERGG